MNKGIPYSNDLTCSSRLKKFHTDGYKNIFSVVVGCSKIGQESEKKSYRMDYGLFPVARSRYDIETATSLLESGWKVDTISLLLTTYSGTKKVNEDVLESVSYSNSRAMKHGVWFSAENRKIVVS